MQQFIKELELALENKQPIYPILQKYPIETMETLFVEPKIGARIKLNKAQKKFVEVLFKEKRDIYALGSRQIAGKSTIARFATLYALIAYPGITIYYVTLKFKGQGADFINRILQMVDYLPEFIRPGYKRVAQDNSMIKFDNGSLLIVAGAQHASDYADLFKSHSVHILIIDEFPNIKRNRELLAAATPTLTATRKVATDKPVVTVLIGNAIEITSESHRYAYKLWLDSIENKTTYVPVLFYYRDILPDNEADKIIQEELTRTQSKRSILVNYECYFLTGEHAFLDDDLVKIIQTKESVDYLDNNVKLWKPLLECINRPIIFGIDVATLYGSDYYAIVGIDAETLDYLVEWTDKTDVITVYNIILNLAQMFPNSIFAIERNLGAHLIELLAEKLDETRLYRDNKNRLGFFTTPQNRNNIFKTMKQILYKKPEIVASKNLFSQLLLLEVGRKIKVDEKLGHDDLIMAFGIALQVWYDIVNGFDKNLYALNFNASEQSIASNMQMFNKVIVESIKQEYQKKLENQATISFQQAVNTYNNLDYITDPNDLFIHLFLR
ncbi:MAG: hypothetical protein F9Y92_05715 [Thermoplasmatales archaeon]|nr:hypothetical protein [Thermoplasmatales archaeon]